MSKRCSRYPRIRHLSIPDKANRILNILLVVLLLFVARIWHLTVIQHEEKVVEAQKPQQKIVHEPGKRGTIRDRFNIPLAINKMQYNAAILYSQIRQIPTVRWVRSSEGVKIKKYPRREYIHQLSHLLGDVLSLDPERLEELIHAKAAMYFQLPFVVSEGIHEKQYYQIKMLEKEWIGVQAQMVPQRYYPHGRVASDIIGYMGAINREEYETFIREMKTLELFLQQWENGEEPPFPEGITSIAEAYSKFHDLKESAYTMRDYVGKAGVEGRFEKLLRGYHGEKKYASDSRGNFLRELPGGYEPKSGNRLLLSISAELQEYAEQLLVKNEQIREARVSYGIGVDKKVRIAQKNPWIKGGSIIAMDPNTGEVLALASHPRYDPNDFIISGNKVLDRDKQNNILRWFDSEVYVGQIWDQRRALNRELYQESKGGFYEDSKMLTWKNFLTTLFPEDNKVYEQIKKYDTIADAVLLQRDFDNLLTFSGQGNAYWLTDVLFNDKEHTSHGEKMPSAAKEMIIENLDLNSRYTVEMKKRVIQRLKLLPQNYDKVLLVDLYRVALDGNRFSENLLQKVGRQNLAEYNAIQAAYIVVKNFVYQMTQRLFHDLDFKDWRTEYEKQFLKEKRAIEKEQNKYAKPYIDYLDSKEKEMFNTFWEKNRWDLMLIFLKGENQEHLSPYSEHFLSWYKELTHGAHQSASWFSAYEILVTALLKLDRAMSIEYLHTMRSFDDLNRPLLGSYRYLRRDAEKIQREKHLAGAFYPAYGYGYGRSYAYRQATHQGSIFKIVTAYEALAQLYEKKKGNVYSPADLNPMEIVDVVQKQGKSWVLGYTDGGKPITQMYKGGRMPRSVSKNIGKVDIFRAFEQSSNPYFALLASEVIAHPDDLSNAARMLSYGERTGIDLPGEIRGKVPNDLSNNRTGLYAFAIGHNKFVVSPLQTAVMLATMVNGGYVLKPQIVKMIVKNEVVHVPPHIQRQVPMSPIVREMLCNMMHRVISKTHHDGIYGLANMYRDYPEAIRAYDDLAEDMGGKTSTSESVENIDLDLQKGTNTYNHIWFGGVVFDQNGSNTFLMKDQWGKPELVVVVYLRYGGFGKDAVPIAAQMGQRWREIKNNSPY